MPQPQKNINIASTEPVDGIFSTLLYTVFIYTLLFVQDIYRKILGDSDDAYFAEVL